MPAHSLPAASLSSASAAPAGRLALALLATTLGAIYLVAAVTAPTIALAAFQALVGAAELAWAAATILGPPRPALLRTGALAQLALVALWAMSRTIGLDGPALPVGALDTLCAVDATLIGASALRTSTLSRPRGSMLACQLAAMLAGMTLFTLCVHAHTAASARGFAGGPPGAHYFCRPL